MGGGLHRDQDQAVINRQPVAPDRDSARTWLDLEADYREVVRDTRAFGRPPSFTPGLGLQVRSLQGQAVWCYFGGEVVAWPLGLRVSRRRAPSPALRGFPFRILGERYPVPEFHSSR